MIQPLRTVHRRAFVVLSLLLPTVLVMALIARSQLARINWISPAVSTPATVPQGTKIVWRRHSIPTTLVRTADQPKTSFVFGSLRDLLEPDVLLYWTAAEPHTGSLPADAIFLGAVVSGQTALRTLPESPAGYLVLYALPQHSVVDTAPLESLP
jgi:hypothetical protein